MLLISFVSFICTGCVTEFNPATGRQESVLYDTEKEQKIGDSIAARFDKEFEIVTEVDVNERVQRILRRITTVSDRRDMTYIIKVIKAEEEEELNAVALPGGRIYLFKGLVDFVDNDDQLAGVIGHEVGHIAAKHSMKKLQAIYGYSFLTVLAGASGNANLARGVGAVFTAAFFSYSQEDEFLADKLGVQYAKKAGYDPKGVVEFLAKLKQHKMEEPIRKYGYWRTHPHLSKRIAMANKEIQGEMSFRDYLNLTEEDSD